MPQKPSPMNHQPSTVDSSVLSKSPPSFPKNYSLKKFISFSIVPVSVWIIGCMMCLINISFVMIYSLSALYLNTSLGVSTVWIGLLEGIVEGISFLMKLCSGMLSDYLRRRKVIMVVGYTLTVISKPLLALSSSFAVVFAARLFERLGNGIQATPRDAMVGDIAPQNHRGSCFGLMRSLGVAGSFMGGLLGAAAMKLTHNNFQNVFWIATIPALCAITILILFVKDPRKKLINSTTHQPMKKTDRRPIKLSDILLLGRSYWMLMIIVSIFMMARVSETLMVLYAHNDFGLEKTYAPLIMSLYNSTYCLSSYPSGWISDRFGRHVVLAFGVGALVVADFFLSSATSLAGVFTGVLIWGIQMGVAQNIFVSLIADYVPADLRGTGFGFYYLISAISSVIAGLGGGTITHYHGVATTFFASMLVSIIALITLLVFLPKSQKVLAISANSQ
jgi:MFS family permease